MVIILFVMRSEEKLLGVAFLIPMYLSVRQLSIYLMTLLYHYGKGRVGQVSFALNQTV